jgi:hypothetical protein
MRDQPVVLAPAGAGADQLDRVPTSEAKTMTLSS